MGTSQQRITAYLEKFTGQWPRYGRAWHGQRTMASAYSAGQIADALLADAEFRALRLGTWLNTPSGELVAAAVMALTPPPFQQDIDLLVEALQLGVSVRLLSPGTRDCVEPAQYAETRMACPRVLNRPP